MFKHLQKMFEHICNTKGELRWKLWTTFEMFKHISKICLNIEKNV